MTASKDGAKRRRPSFFEGEGQLKYRQQFRWVENQNQTQKAVAWFFLAVAAITTPVAIDYFSESGKFAELAEKFGPGDTGVALLSSALALIGILGIISFCYLVLAPDEIRVPGDLPAYLEASSSYSKT